MSKLTDAMLERLSKVLELSASDLDGLESIDKETEYPELSKEKNRILKKVVLNIDSTNQLDLNDINKDSVVDDTMLSRVNKLFDDILLGNNSIQPAKVINESIKPQKARLRDKSGKFFSLIKLKDLINKALHNAIQRNMGKGNARTILNYRTGRFARSATVEQLKMDRDGNIQAFYTYMKYPYQTFEPGFAQGYPESRDPRILIGKSIRQVAKEIVTARLKAIRV